VVGGIACHADNVALLDERRELETITLPATEIERDLLARPLVYRSGTPSRVSRARVEAAGMPPYARMDLNAALAALGVGAVVSVGSAVALSRARRPRG
jgi:hypothetical protein